MIRKILTSLNPWTLATGILIGIGTNNLIIYRFYPSRFEAEVACNQSYLYCHHDKEPKQVLGLDHEKARDFILGWPVVQRFRY